MGFFVQCLPYTPANQQPLSRKRRIPDRRQANILSDIFPAAVTDAGAIGFILSHIPATAGPILWVQDRLSRKEAGCPYLPGLGMRRQILNVDLSRPADVLWAMEDGLRCKAISAVIGEVWGDPPALNFTATKRLAMRAEQGRVPCWLIRRAASPDLSAARNRWRVASLPSSQHPDDPHAPGNPCWRVELFRSRLSKPGEWVATYDHAADRVDFSALLRDGAMAEDGREGKRRTAR